jgi:Xaa-Pro dipeptidase
MPSKADASSLDPCTPRTMPSWSAATSRCWPPRPTRPFAVYSGAPRCAFRDDQSWPFRAGAFYQQWVPCDEHAGCVLLFRPGRKPLLVLNLPQRLLALRAGAAGRAVDRAFRHHRSSMTCGRARRAAEGPRRPARWSASRTKAVAGWGCAALNPAAVVTRWSSRGCTRRPTRSSASPRQPHCRPGHLAARDAFLDRASEFGIHLAYLDATGHSEAELPYANIIALNEHGATLHYGRFERQRPSRAAAS